MADIRLRTRCIIEKNGLYLVALGGFRSWSDSPYDAWHTRRKMFAYRVAWRLGGSVMLFNPIIGRTARMGRGTETGRAEAEKAKASGMEKDRTENRAAVKWGQ